MDDAVILMWAETAQPSSWPSFQSRRLAALIETGFLIYHVFDHTADEPSFTPSHAADVPSFKPLQATPGRAFIFFVSTVSSSSSHSKLG